MVKAVVLYGPPEDPATFERHDAETHAALAKAIPGLQRFEAAQGIATPDGGSQRHPELRHRWRDHLLRRDRLMRSADVAPRRVALVRHASVPARSL
jgi:hypothetical protein